MQQQLVIAFCAALALTASAAPSVRGTDTEKCLAGIPCTLEYVPICADDGVTYGNKCTFEAAKKCANPKLKKHSDGECDPEYCMSKTSCTLEHNPVCGSDGKTYGNKCMFDAWARCSLDPELKLAHEGECLSKDAMECMAKIPCTLEWAPICGTDLVTYGNKCQFDATKKCAKPDLKKKKDGEC